METFVLPADQESIEFLKKLAGIDAQLGGSYTVTTAEGNTVTVAVEGS